jgi:hypothetical protein
MEDVLSYLEAYRNHKQPNGQSGTTPILECGKKYAELFLQLSDEMLIYFLDIEYFELMYTSNEVLPFYEFLLQYADLESRGFAHLRDLANDRGYGCLIDTLIPDSEFNPEQHQDRDCLNAELDRQPTPFGRMVLADRSFFSSN